MAKIDQIELPNGQVYDIQDNVSGYTTNTGTVTSVAGGTGLNGGTITTSGTLSVKYGSASGTACEGNDSRLSDARPSSDVVDTYSSDSSVPISGKGVSAAINTLPTFTVDSANNTLAIDNIPELGSKEITVNGTYNASSDNLDGYSSVVVNVSGGGGGGKTLVYTLTAGAQWETFTLPSGYTTIIVEYTWTDTVNNYTYLSDSTIAVSSLPDRIQGDVYVTVGLTYSTSGMAGINVAKNTSDGYIYISVNGAIPPDASVKVYVPQS